MFLFQKCACYLQNPNNYLLLKSHHHRNVGSVSRGHLVLLLQPDEITRLSHHSGEQSVGNAHPVNSRALGQKCDNKDR